MSDSFSVAATDTEILDSSHLVAELQEECRSVDSFPVLLGRNVATFHDVEGGYHRSEGYHVVNLIHEVQGDDSPPSDVYHPEVEIHLDGFWCLEVEDVREYGNYPEENYVLSLQVTGYQGGPYSFSDELQEDVDKRETEYNYE